MRLRDIGPAWVRILRGHKPLLSLEITKECPLRCPGCYAYEPGHLGSSGPLRLLSDYRGEALVAAVLALVRRFRPIHYRSWEENRWFVTTSSESYSRSWPR